MAITLDEAKAQLNIPLDVTTDDTELTFYVNVANEWIADEAAEPTSYRAQLATRMLVEHWWRTQRGPAGGVFGDDGDSDRDFWRSIPPNVKELLSERQTTATTPQYDFPDAGAWPDPVAS